MRDFTIYRKIISCFYSRFIIVIFYRNILFISYLLHEVDKRMKSKIIDPFYRAYDFAFLCVYFISVAAICPGVYF